MILSLLACTPDDPPVWVSSSPREVEVRLAPAMPTVAHLVWTSPEPVVGRVTGAGFADVVDPAPVTEHDLRVVGLHAEETVGVTVWEGDTAVAEVEVLTGALDPAIRPLDVHTPLDGLDDTSHLLWSAVDFSDAGRLGRFSTGTITLVDRDGLPVWGVALGDRFPMFPAYVPGQGVVGLSTDFNDYANSTWDTWDLDGVRTSTPLPGAHHEAVLRDDGAVVYTRTESRTVEGELVGGDMLVERTVDGVERVVWDAFAQLPVEPNWGWEATELADGAADWTHANGLRWSDVDGLCHLSLYGPQQVVAIDTTTGTNRWLLGEGGDFALGPGASFGPQHSPVPTPGGLLLFDNQTQHSRVVEIALDEGAGTATLAWQWPGDGEGAWNPLMGHVEVLPAGELLLSWGLVPEVWALGADREVVGAWAIDDPAFVGALGAIRGVEGL